MLFIMYRGHSAFRQNLFSFFFSLSSDYDIAVPSFLRVIKVACKLFATPQLIGNIRPRVYTAGSGFYTRMDSTSSRIRAAISGRLSSSNSSSSDDHELPLADMFAPLEEVWEALDEWFFLLWNEMEEIEGEVTKQEECTSVENGTLVAKDHLPISHVTGSGKRHLSENLSERFSFPMKQEEAADTQKKCSLSRSVSASGRLGEQLPRNVAAALVPYRAQSVRHKLIRMTSGAAFRLSQPAIEMNLDRRRSPSSPDWSSGDTVFTFPSAANNNRSSRSRTLELRSNQQNGSSYSSDSTQALSSPELNNREEFELCEPRVETRTASPAFSSVDNDVIAMTADRLCVITHGFYLCCCHQSHWNRR